MLCIINVKLVTLINLVIILLLLYLLELHLILSTVGVVVGTEIVLSIIAMLHKVLRVKVWILVEMVWLLIVAVLSKIVRLLLELLRTIIQKLLLLLIDSIHIHIILIWVERWWIVVLIEHLGKFVSEDTVLVEIVWIHLLLGDKVLVLLLILLIIWICWEHLKIQNNLLDIFNLLRLPHITTLAVHLLLIALPHILRLHIMINLQAQVSKLLLKSILYRLEIISVKLKILVLGLIIGQLLIWHKTIGIQRYLSMIEVFVDEVLVIFEAWLISTSILVWIQVQILLGRAVLVIQKHKVWNLRWICLAELINWLFDELQNDLSGLLKSSNLNFNDISDAFEVVFYIFDAFIILNDSRYTKIKTAEDNFLLNILDESLNVRVYF